MNKIQIPEGWYQLNPEERVCEGDKFFRPAFGEWELSGNYRNGQQSTEYVYIRNGSPPTPFKIGDKVEVSGKTGVIHGERTYLKNGFGYSIKFDEAIETKDFGYSLTIASLREDLIKHQEKPIMAAGYEVKFEAGHIKVGCQTISNEVVKQIAAKLK